MKYKRNKIFSALESLIYSSGQMFLGLLLHPYRSMQLLVKNKILLPFILYPTFVGIFFYLLLKVDVIAFGYQSFFIFRFFYQVTLFFCIYWQLALFYLWLRFSRAFSRL